jgi:glycosyltransferase involved in cell wall biosynthesis
MKIAYCIPLIDGTGGMERVLSLKANYLAENFGYHIFIILTDQKDSPPFYTFSPNIQIINLDINYEELWSKTFLVRIFIYLMKQKKYKKALNKILKEIKPDITISMLRREVNFINSINDGSLKIGEFHFNKESYRDYRRSIPFKPLQKIATSWGMSQLTRKLKKLSKLIVLSYEDKKKWAELDNVTVIYNPLPFFPDQIAPLTQKEVIAVGRYTYQKGFDLLIEAWKIVHEKHPDWQLHIYGGGKGESLLNQIHVFDLDNSCFLERPVKNIEEKYLESSIFVLSSRYEGFPMVLLEAMSCGVPPVSFDCLTGPKEIIKDRKDGLLVENGNIEELAQKICYLIENEDLRKEMGRQARISSERFKIEHIMDQWKELFDTLIQSRSVNP